MDGNSLLIRNTALSQAANNKYLGITTAFALEITNVDAQQQLEKGSMSSNQLVLDNVLVSHDESFSNTNIRIGAVHLLNQQRHGEQMSAVDLNDNQVFIRNSDIAAYSIYASMIEVAALSYQATGATGNQVVIDESNILLGGDWGESESQGNPAVAATVKTSNAESNSLYLNQTSVTLNYEGVADSSQKASILSAVNGATTANNNTTVLTDVSLLLNGTPAQSDEGELQSVLIAGASATMAGLANAVNANTAGGNRLYVGGSSSRVDMRLEGMQSILSGADSVVTQPANLQGTVSGSLAVVQHADLGKTSIYGGWARGYTHTTGAISQGTALVSDNEVQVQDISADEATVIGGYTVRGQTSTNTVTVEGADITKAVLVGGAAQEYGSASGNTVTVGDARLGEGSSIYGGWVRTGAADNTAENNTIVLQDNVTGTGGGVLKLDALYGGFAQTAADGANTAFVGNKLYNSTRVETKALGGIQQYNFITTQAQLDAGALITVTGTDAVVIEPTGANASTVAVGGADIALQAGTTYTLIDSAAGFTDLAGTQLDQTTNLDAVKQDLTVTSLPSVFRVQTNTVSKDDYDLKIEAGTGASGGDSLVMTVAGEPGTDLPGGSSSINDQTNTLVESALSTLATTIAADDLFVDSVLRSRTGARQGLFAAARAGKYSYDTNTRLETNIVQGLLGFGASLGNTNVGGFIEMGHGSYDSRMNSLLGDVTGEGSQNFAGVGVYVDYGLPIDGWRLTGYIKGGQIDNSFSATIAGVNAGYDEENFYWGAHLGTHYDFDVADLMRARVFLSYFYNGVDSSSYDIAGNAEIGGAHISIDSINAHRVQAGSMLEFLPGSNLRPYLGLTVEQTIAAEASGTATDAKGTMDLNASDLEGTTGILSAGWTYSAGSFSTELGLNGYAGTRNGFSGQIQASWTF